MGSRQWYWIALGAGVAASAAIDIAMARLALEVGSSAGAWTYRYVQGFSASMLIAGLLAAGTAGAALRLPVPDSRREWWFVAAWLTIAFVIQALLRSLTLFTFAEIFASEGANSFYSFARQHDAYTALTDFDRLRASAPLHAQSNMPGKLMLVYALQLVSNDPATLAWMVAMVSNLGAVLMYVFVRDLFDDRTTAAWAMVLYLFVPSKLVFLPLMNTVTPVFVLACLCLLLRWLRTRTVAAAALLGSSLYLLVFFEPLPLVSGLLFAALAMRAVMTGGMDWYTLVLQTAAVILAFIGTAEIAHLALNFDLLGTFRDIREHAAAFNAAEGRPYLVWIHENLWEFAIGTGMCQLFLLSAVLTRLAGTSGRQLLTDPLAVVTLSLLATLLAVDLIGINRGEVTRLWIFLSCLFQIPAAWVCARLGTPAAIGIVAGTSIVQAAIGTGVVGFVVP